MVDSDQVVCPDEGEDEVKKNIYRNDKEVKIDRKQHKEGKTEGLNKDESGNKKKLRWGNFLVGWMDEDEDTGG